MAMAAAWRRRRHGNSYCDSDGDDGLASARRGDGGSSGNGDCDGDGDGPASARRPATTHNGDDPWHWNLLEWSWQTSA